MKSANASAEAGARQAHPLLPDGQPQGLGRLQHRLAEGGPAGGRQHGLHRDVRGPARAEGPVGGAHQLPRRLREPHHGAHRQAGAVLRGAHALARRLQAQEGGAAGGQGHQTSSPPTRSRPPASTCPTSRTSARSTAARACWWPTSWRPPPRCGGCRWPWSSPARPRIAPRPRSTRPPRASGWWPSTRCSAMPRARWTRRS